MNLRTRGGEGVQNPENFADVLYVWSLRSRRLPPSVPRAQNDMIPSPTDRRRGESERASERSFPSFVTRATLEADAIARIEFGGGRGSSFTYSTNRGKNQVGSDFAFVIRLTLALNRT